MKQQTLLNVFTGGTAVIETDFEDDRNIILGDGKTDKMFETNMQVLSEHKVIIAKNETTPQHKVSE